MVCVCIKSSFVENGVLTKSLSNRFAVAEIVGKLYVCMYVCAQRKNAAAVAFALQAII